MAAGRLERAWPTYVRPSWPVDFVAVVKVGGRESPGGGDVGLSALSEDRSMIVWSEGGRGVV
ncbi:MAG TPA: hypothetical protein VGG41_04915 [Solirubrobacteraceae bacterium]